MPDFVDTRLHYDSEIPELTRLNMEDLWKKINSVYSRGTLGVRFRSVAANTTLNYDDNVILVDTSAAARTITLPSANSWGTAKSPIIVLIRSSTANALTITASGSDTIIYFASTLLVSGTSIVSRGITVLVSNGLNSWTDFHDEVGVEFVPVRTLTGAATLSVVDRQVICSNSAGNYNVTLPAANSAGGLSLTYNIQRDNTGVLIVATIVVTGGSGDALVVDPGKAAALAVNDGCTVFSNGNNLWFLH